MPIQLSDDEKAATPDPLAGYFTDEQLAKLLHRSPRTLARWRAQRRLPFVLLGKTPLSSREHVAQMLRASEVRARRQGR
jgi:hypothetical protein